MKGSGAIYSSYGEIKIISISDQGDFVQKVAKSLALLECQEASNYIIKCEIKHFNTGEAKAIVDQSVRGKDVYLVIDINNYEMKYLINGQFNHMSPDDHYHNLKRVISALSGKARRINVIMPILYGCGIVEDEFENSLYGAITLKELSRLGVNRIISFNVPELGIQNALSLKGFEILYPVKSIVETIKGHVYGDNICTQMVVISMNRTTDVLARNFSHEFGSLNGVLRKISIQQWAYFGPKVVGLDIIFVVGHAICSSMLILEAVKALKTYKFKRFFVYSAFGFYEKDLNQFDAMYQEGVFERLYTTNLSYQSGKFSTRSYYYKIDLSGYVADLIYSLNQGKDIDFES